MSFQDCLIEWISNESDTCTKSSLTVDNDNHSIVSINQSIKSSICKVPLKQSSQRHLLWVGLHKEPSLEARLELFVTNITVLDMRWQNVPNLGCHDAETARTIRHGLRTWYNHVIVVSTAKPRTKGNGDDRWTDVAEVHWWSAMDTVKCHQRNSERNALRHGQLNSPRSAIQQTPLDFTRMFLLFKSRWAIPALPTTQYNIKHIGMQCQAHRLHQNSNRLLWTCKLKEKSDNKVKYAYLLKHAK